MLRLRFASGLLLGLVLGLSAGTLIGLLVVPPHAADSVAATPLQVLDLTHKLEAAKEDKERVDRQLEQFAQLADQMTASFNSLEQRFKALEEEQRLNDTQRSQIAAPAAHAAAPGTTPSVADAAATPAREATAGPQPTTAAAPG
ncbi:MAG TPA: hypothetical protein VN812_08575 [Candidatus Acidoferrales bacterium]|nr:hypothetical protein [Candidatus Acidoferrales bacterium]